MCAIVRQVNSQTGIHIDTRGHSRFPVGAVTDSCGTVVSDIDT